MAVGTKLQSQSLRLIVLAVLGQLLMLAPALGFDDTHSGIRFGKNADYWEVRFGGGAYDFGPTTPSDFSGGVVNFEVVAPSPDFLARIGAPRPYIGTDIAISDDAIHVVYAGLNWEAYVTRRLYFGFSGGGSWNTGPKQTAASGASKNLGSVILFHLQLSIGFDITEKLTAQVYLNHVSNAYIANSNPGLESVGGRVGVRF